MKNTSGQDLAGRRIAITGAGRGIGRATAAELVRRGATVCIGDIDAGCARDTAEALGPSVTSSVLDVTDSASFAAFLDQARSDMGGLDVLINNAGVMPIGRFLEQSEEIVRRSTDINLIGPILGMRLALPDMLARGRGHIVNVSSSAGKAAVPGGLNYGAQKAGLVHLTEGARIEFAGRGVDFTCVIPFFTNTDLISGTKGAKLVRTVEPEEVAREIATAIVKRKKDVYTPGLLRPLLAMQPLVGRRLRDGMYRALGAYDTFLDVDRSRRSDYDRRINGN